jgi:hypothetical protein
MLAGLHNNTVCCPRPKNIKPLAVLSAVSSIAPPSLQLAKEERQQFDLKACRQGRNIVPSAADRAVQVQGRDKKKLYEEIGKISISTGSLLFNCQDLSRCQLFGEESLETQLG